MDTAENPVRTCPCCKSDVVLNWWDPIANSGRCLKCGAILLITCIDKDLQWFHTDSKGKRVGPVGVVKDGN
jgi:transcription initiation factor TFIIIB Brf1 subunit/transcription initiation factor TFIIB